MITGLIIEFIVGGMFGVFIMALALAAGSDQRVRERERHG